MIYTQKQLISTSKRCAEHLFAVKIHNTGGIKCCKELKITALLMRVLYISTSVWVLRTPFTPKAKVLLALIEIVKNEKGMNNTPLF